MNLTPEQRLEIVMLRLENADHALDDARHLLERNSIRGAANRAYYAAFYAVSALAVSQGKVFRKHSRLISFFHADCVRSGLFDKRYGRILQKAFEDRSEADYEDDILIGSKEIEARIGEVSELIEAIKRHLNL